MMLMFPVVPDRPLCMVEVAAVPTTLTVPPLIFSVPISPVP